MMHAARRALPLVAFFLLTSAAAAHAECAWVFWASDRTAIGMQYYPWGAMTTKAECEKKAASYRESSAAALSESGFGVRALDFICLPDTVDPRGTKAK